MNLTRTQDSFDKASLKDLVVLTDDTEDFPSISNSFVDNKHYYQWHSLILTKDHALEKVELWKKIKSELGIGSWLHSKKLLNKIKNDSSRFKILVDFCLSLEIQHCISHLDKQTLDHELNGLKNDSIYSKLRRGWYIDCPKQYSLYWHYILVDRYIMEVYPSKVAYAYNDRTKFSFKIFDKHALSTDSWGHLGHYHLETINPDIRFRLHKNPNSEIGFLLDLADFFAWSHRRFLDKAEMRRFGKGGEDLTDNILDKLINDPKNIDQRELFKFVIDLLHKGTSKYLHIEDLKS